MTQQEVEDNLKEIGETLDVHLRCINRLRDGLESLLNSMKVLARGQGHDVD